VEVVAVRSFSRRLCAVALGTVAAVGAVPGSASAAAAGTAYGGVTPQGWPVALEMNKSGKQIVRATIGLRLNCTSGGFTNQSDQYKKITLNKQRKFKVSFGPDITRNPDGSTFDYQGSASGKLNAARTKFSGTWQLKLTEHDVTGAVTDTCDSGPVSWTAKQ
jgi:hypothetical protein